MTDQLDLTHLGLSEAEVAKSRADHGANRLTPPKRPSLWHLYLEKYQDPIIKILLLAAIISLGIGIYEQDFVETIGIVVAILLATTIGFYFEWDAARRFDVLNALKEEDLVTVVRGGKIVQIARTSLVVGDIVILQQGDEVPADGQLIRARNMQVDESSLTGEPSTYKTTDKAHFDAEATYPSDRVMRSSKVLDGYGLMEVTAVGDHTEIGSVAREASRPVEIDTPLNKQLKRLANVITRVALIVSICVFVAGTARGIYDYFQLLSAGEPTDWMKVAEIVLQYFMLAVTLIVMAVPEGLPMAVSLSLALNMRRMLKTNNLVRRMHACETMGAVTVICTDKTGTLTQNRMEVVEMHYEAADETLLMENIACNSTAHVMDDGLIAGNPTEGALLKWLNTRGEDYKAWRSEGEMLSQQPFSTELKYMASVVRSSKQHKTLLYVKGAPEIVASKCELTEDQADGLALRLRGYQAKAMRTLAFACREVDDEEDIDCRQLVAQGGLRLIGVAAITDPVREEVPAAVAAVRRAGIQIKIVTGDTAGTAVEIARRIGLWEEGDGEDNVITGSEFARLSDEEASKRLASLKVMARARPMDKQRLVSLLQAQGEVVAVTGDGTNDAPALNHAQVGLSMGSGTSVAKEASDITLIDDSFGSIATAVMWGRSLYKNIQRFITFQLTICITALVVSIIGAFVGSEMPLTVTQILWVNLIMDTFASLALSTIPPDINVMKDKPRKPSDFIITRPMAGLILGTAALFVVALCYILVFFDRNQLFDASELTLFFTAFVFAQLWNLLNMKPFLSRQSAFRHLWECKGLLFVMAVILVGQYIIVQLGGDVFRVVPLDWKTWLCLLASTSVIFWIGEIQRGVRRLLHHHLS